MESVELESVRLGLMQTGGIGKSWTIKFLILVDPPMLSKIHYFFGTLLIT